MKTARFLFGLGVIIMVLGVIANVYTVVHNLSIHVVGYNTGAVVVSILSPLWQGALLIGAAKIIELVSSKQN